MCVKWKWVFIVVNTLINMMQDVRGLIKDFSVLAGPKIDHCCYRNSCPL